MEGHRSISFGGEGCSKKGQIQNREEFEAAGQYRFISGLRDRRSRGQGDSIEPGADGFFVHIAE